MHANYISKTQRIQLAHQSRRSHLILGHSSSRYSTTQTTFHRPAASSATPTRAVNSRTASHFTLGFQTPSRRSEFSVNYRVHSLEPRKPSPLIKDLTPSSVILGTQNVRFSTTNIVYRDPSNSKIESYSNSALKNRKNNFQLGNDASTKKSLMQKDYSKMVPEKPFEVQKNLLDSHVVMGNHPDVLRSTTKKEYFKKNGPSGSLPDGKLRDLKQEHFVLGKDAWATRTINSSSYKPKEIQKQGLPDEKLTYLKNSHFGFQAEKPDYSSETNTKMRYTPTEIRDQPQYLKVNHVVLGGHQSKFFTNYSRNHYYRSQSVNHPERTKTQELNSDVILGVTHPAFSTTTNSIISGKPGIPGRMDPAYERMLRTHHYSLGTTTGIYKQPHKNYGSGEPDPSKFLQDLKVDLLNTHWANGKHDGVRASSMKTDYKPVAGVTRKCEDYLKRHNYKLGSDRENWSSSYNGGFKWIQPVTGPPLKFSFN